MREALAGTNHDYLLRDDDRSETKRRGGRGKAKKSAWTRLFGGRRRGLLFLSFAALVAVGIPLNALYLQEGRHPAPLFHAAAPELRHAAESAHVEAAPPLPPARPAAPAPAPAPAAPAVKPPVAKSEPAHVAEKRDAIGALLSAGAPKKDEADKNVLTAQRALAKLGYPVHTDGVLGGATRQALEKFERANRMPVTGELTPKIMRRLLAAHATPPVQSAPISGR